MVEGICQVSKCMHQSLHDRDSKFELESVCVCVCAHTPSGGKNIICYECYP